MNKELLKDWFHYHLSARRGIIVLCSILLLSVACRILLPRWIKPEFEPISAYSFVLSKLPEEEETQDFSDSPTIIEEESTEVIAEVFPFDPNSLDDEGWKRLGLSEGQIRSIRNFQHSGGRFKIKSDLSKMYVISPELFEKWESFIQLPDELIRSENESVGNKKTDFVRSYTQININTADSIQLLNLPGIGPYYAGAIVRYRNKLGGFLQVNQLLEIWKMKPETVELIQDKILVQSSDVRFISINTISAAELSTHPYMNNTKAKALISYRDKHGPFAKPEDIRNCAVIDDDTFSKIIAYLKL